MQKWMRGLLVAVLAAVCLPSHASLITLDFNSATPGYYLYEPYYEDGFRVYSVPVPYSSDQFPTATSIQSHYDMQCGGAGSGSPVAPNCGTPGGFFPNYDGTTWLGTDSTRSRLLDAEGNVVANAGGCCSESHIRIDRFGSLFSVLDFQAIAASLISSRGGFAGGSFFDTVTVSGDLWRDVEWIELSVGTMVGAPVGIDNLRVRVVHEPSALAVLGLALAAFVFRWRRQLQLANV